MLVWHIGILNVKFFYNYSVGSDRFRGVETERKAYAFLNALRHLVTANNVESHLTAKIKCFILFELIKIKSN